ncbi:MAG: hypothetical protein U1D35_10330 [Paracoccaceae bacterium]|nr:hypothetical protein [Paracoccaceae bacterium]
MEGERGYRTARRSVPIEADLLILSFLGHFTWELLQAPLFSSLDGTSHFAGIVICLRATLGDMGIALAAFWAAAMIAGGRKWVARPTPRSVAAYLGTGLIVTIGFEYVSTEVLNRWSYAPQMPRLPVLGTGLAPLLQWLIIPTLVLWYLKRLAPRA